MPTIRPHCVAAAAFLAALTAAGPAFAQAEVPALPQLNPAFWPTQLFWLAITFAVLYVVMSKLALPRIESVLTEREKLIAADLAKAEELRSETETVMASYERALGDARAEARQVVADATAQAERDMAAKLSAQDAELSARLDAAMTRIDAARKTALGDVTAMAADLARDLTGKLAGVDVSEAASTAAVARAAGSEA